MYECPFGINACMRNYGIDHGHWMEPETVVNNARGRGILLMRALADECTIDGGEDGTTVCLRFYGCPPNSFAISQAC